jgi:hypothetical protein
MCPTLPCRATSTSYKTDREHTDEKCANLANTLHGALQCRARVRSSIRRRSLRSRKDLRCLLIWLRMVDTSSRGRRFLLLKNISTVARMERAIQKQGVPPVATVCRSTAFQTTQAATYEEWTHHRTLTRAEACQRRQLARLRHSAALSRRRWSRRHGRLERG